MPKTATYEGFGNRQNAYGYSPCIGCCEDMRREGKQKRKGPILAVRIGFSRYETYADSPYGLKKRGCKISMYCTKDHAYFFG